jgi:WD repeat-containing protein 70
VLYSPRTSTNGAKLVANRGAAKKATVESMSEMAIAPQIIAPHALSMFKEGDDVIATLGSMKRKRERERNDPRKARRPELPVVGPGKGGRVGASATQHVVQNLFRDTTRDVDVSALFAAQSHAYALLATGGAAQIRNQGWRGVVVDVWCVDSRLYCRNFL